MARRFHKLTLCAAASLLGLAGVLFVLVRPSLHAGAPDSRALQVWPDRVAGVSSGRLRNATARTIPSGFPFGVYRTDAGDVVRARTYLQFPLDVFPPGTDVLRATLYVHVDSSSGSGEAPVGVYRVLESWEGDGLETDPATWPRLLTSPIAVTTARVDVVTPTVAVSTPTPTATPTLSPTPTVQPTQPVSTAIPAAAAASAPSLMLVANSHLSANSLSRDLANGALVSIDPSSSKVALGSTTKVDIRVEDVAWLYGAEVYLDFDPDLLEVVDADADESGVQVELGTFLSPDFVTENSVDQVDGSIEFAVVQLEPSEPVTGSGTLAVVEFRGIARGTSALTFEDALLSDIDGMPIDSDTQDGSIAVTDEGTPSPTPTSPSSPLATPTLTPTPRATATPTPTPTPDLASTVPVTLRQVAGTWLAWDVTALMRAWVAGEVADDGVALAAAPDPGATPETEPGLLLARWLTVEDQRTRPYLIVEYDVLPVTATATPAPTLPPAGGSAGWGAVALLLAGAGLLIIGLAVRRR